MAAINARRHVGTGFPPDEGRVLAESLLSDDQVDWNDLVVDLRGCPPGLLISAFFNGFLQCVHENNPALLTAAKSITWDVKFDFQKENIKTWIKNFEPVGQDVCGKGSFA